MTLYFIRYEMVDVSCIGFFFRKKKLLSKFLIIYNLQSFLLNLRSQVDQEISTLHVAGESKSALYGCLAFLSFI